MTSSTARSQTAEVVPQPFFLETPGGSRFAVLNEPADRRTAVGALLLLPPFAEELNKTRRALARTAAAFCAQGWFVLRIDLYGTGDSPGEFEDASWQSWLDDIAAAADWLQARAGRAPVLWGIRTGALLACESASRRPQPSHALLWQPASSGENFLTQFLRLRVAADAFAETATRSTTASLRAELRSGAPVDVAGYTLTERIAGPLSEARLEIHPRWCRSALWLEATAETTATLSPAAQRAIRAAQANGVPVASSSVPCDAFWQTVEIAEAPSMISASIDWLSGVADA